MTSWHKIKLEEALNYVQPTNFIVSNTNYDDSYEVPVLTPGKSFLLGYTDDRHGIYDNVPTIIFDDFTTDFKYVDFPFKVKSSAMKILELNSEEYDIKFLFYLMQTLNFNASEHKRYWISKYSKQIVNVPLLEEQKQIAAILNAADSLRQKDQQLVDHYNALSQSLFLDMFGDPVSNPMKWEERTLAEVCEKLTDGTHHSPELSAEGCPYVTARHIKESGLDFFSKPTFVDQKAHDGIYKRCNPEYGDVLYIKDGATTGVACINTFHDEISLLSSVALMKVKPDVLNNRYLCSWLNNKGIKAKLINQYMSGAAIKRYTLKKISTFRLMLPTIERQTKFAALLENIDKQKQQAQANLIRSETLFNSLLQRAFNGELTGSKVKAA